MSNAKVDKEVKVSCIFQCTRCRAIYQVDVVCTRSTCGTSVTLSGLRSRHTHGCVPVENTSILLTYRESDG